ncbi:two component transcriptional regulator, LuxR family [Desulfonispora thiosulfatigenes DSM 11270]|uniref:Stage 0 sporulation protein A homolog n=1 Tax=Desulfonispora thiosulfatigenes DSM 11270 TaxID=656914 RepID=A0A1W1UVA4_DESTI|nr:response regulator transcription factor [Desulfonispora thiosulfatigenes]SMB85013.1 two component transcriptional regulator, LuxR family [Desulfonispora thiosulfatigenes DSM 11270]
MVEVKTLLIYNHDLFRQKLKKVLTTIKGFQIIDEIRLDLDKLENSNSLRPDVIFLDIEDIEVDEIKIIQRIKGLFPESKLVVLNDYKNENNLIEYITCGVHGLLNKDIEVTELILETKEILNGEVALDKSIGKQIFKELLEIHTIEPNYKTHNITEREYEIIRLVAEGVTNKEIANSLYISENTVKNHLCNIMEKLDVDNRVKIASFAWTKGLINLTPTQ